MSQIATLAATVVIEAAGDPAAVSLAVAASRRLRSDCAAGLADAASPGMST